MEQLVVDFNFDYTLTEIFSMWYLIRFKGSIPVIHRNKGFYFCSIDGDHAYIFKLNSHMTVGKLLLGCLLGQYATKGTFYIETGDGYENNTKKVNNVLTDIDHGNFSVEEFLRLVEFLGVTRDRDVINFAEFANIKFDYRLTIDYSFDQLMNPQLKSARNT